MIIAIYTFPMSMVNLWHRYLHFSVSTPMLQICKMSDINLSYFGTLLLTIHRSNKQRLIKKK